MGINPRDNARFLKAANDAWFNSPEFNEGYAQWVQGPKVPKWDQSQQFRDARLAFRKRINGAPTKGSH